MILRIVIVSSACFGVVKLLFSFLGWYSRDHGDKIYRHRLDVLWDQLQQLNLYQVFNLALAHLTERVRKTFRTRWLGLAFAILAAFFLSLIAVFPAVTLIVWKAAAFAWNDWPFLRVLWWVVWIVWDQHSPPLLIYWVITWTLISTGSTIITWILVNRAVRAKSASTALVHIGLNVVITALAVGLLYAAMILSVILPDYHYYGEFDQHLAFQILVLQARNPELLLMLLLVLGVVAALPTIAYLSLCAWLIILRLLPDAVRRFIVRAVYLITTDKDPVLQTIGNVFGGLGALCGGIIAMLK